MLGRLSSYDIFEAKDDGSDLKRLTDAEGYDAEATINWKTKTILYTSMASGDLDLWTMKLDGSHKKRLTKTYGYDGGAVFRGTENTLCGAAIIPIPIPPNKNMPRCSKTISPAP